MVNPNWGLAMPDQSFGNALLQGMQTGQQLRFQRDQREREKATDAAFRGMMAGDPNAVNALAQIDPRMAYELKTQQNQAAQQEQERQIRIRAAQGDPAAVAELAGVDWDAWQQISKPDKEAMKARTDYLGQAALRISQLPEQQRAQAWDAYIQQGVQLGYQDLAQYQGQYSPQALEALIANSGQVSKLFELEKPQYMAVPNDADLVNVKDPAALSAFAAGRDEPQVMEGQTATNPKTGEKIIFQNGAWVPVGGPASNGGGGFPGGL